MRVIKAQAPLAEVMQYNSQLRSVTGGQGSYTMELSHYEPVPGNVQQQIIAAAKAERKRKRRSNSRPVGCNANRPVPNAPVGGEPTHHEHWSSEVEHSQCPRKPLAQRQQATYNAWLAECGELKCE